MPLTIDATRCTWETIDGETMVIDTRTGELWVVRGIAAAAWDALEGGSADPSTLAAAAGERFGSDAATALAAVLDALHTGGLLTEAAPGAVDAAPVWPAEYAAPELDRFDDIADILTLDPIHDVEPTAGWPYEADLPGAPPA